MDRKHQKSTLVKTSLSDQLIKIILEKINVAHYPPGSRIDIEELKKEFGVSHIPIRDALHKLSEQGLVTIIPRVGYFSVRFTPDEIEDLFEVRTLLELSSISKGIKRINKEALESLKKEYSSIKKLSNTKNIDIQRFFDLSEILHKEIIIQCSNSPLIENIYTGLINKIRISSRIVYLPKEDIDEHLLIIQSLIEEDAVSAKKHLKNHLYAAKNRALKEVILAQG
jgi:DNA-binding GntR family transcriptional regulator